MKKELFFFNFNTLSLFFLKKATLRFLPIKHLIRSFNFKNSTLTLLDTFSFFYILKLSKISFYNPASRFKKLLTKKTNNFFYPTLLKNTGNFLFFNNITYSSANKLQISFNYFKQFLFLTKHKFLYSFITHLKFINTYKKTITFFKKKTLKKGFLKYYFSGIIAFKHGKIWNKAQVKKNVKFFLKQPALLINNSSFSLKNSQDYLLTIKKLYYLTRVFENIKIYNRRIVEMKLFGLRNKLYKKDFRYTVYLKTKIKKYYLKKKKKN